MAIALMFFLYLTCGAKAQFITARDGAFLDPEWRQIILHGVNIVDKPRERSYLSWHGQEQFARMREYGL